MGIPSAVAVSRLVGLANEVLKLGVQLVNQRGGLHHGDRGELSRKRRHLMCQLRGRIAAAAAVPTDEFLPPRVWKMYIARLAHECRRVLTKRPDTDV